MATSDGTLTLRGLSAEARARLKRQAAREKSSVNALVVRLLEAQAGMSPPARAQKVRDLSRFAGRWSAAEAKAFERATAPFATIDPLLWK